MNYIQVEDDKWVKVDGNKSTILSLSALEAELSAINGCLAELPPTATDEELLAWAKLNYPAMNFAVERTTLEARRDAIEVDLANMG